MRNLIKPILAGALICFVSFSSCKKTETVPTDNTDLAIHSDDESRVSLESDAVANDANTTVDGYAAFNGKVENITGIICDASTVLDSANGMRRITITYNGQNCSGTRTRTGTVVLSTPLATRWKDAGGVLTIDIRNLKVTRTSDGKSITLNGTEQITNVSGGRLRDLASVGNITHTITSDNMSITFDNGSSRIWQIAKKRVFSYNNGIVITTTGTHTDGTITRISEWGTNRFGGDFVTTITEPLVTRQDCNFRLTSGQVTHSRMLATVVVTFGLDAQGASTSCPTGVYYYKIVWTGANGISRTYILPY
jgi:hypothetical protein